MKRALVLALLALLGFLVILLSRLPASWAAGALPKDITCGALDGSIWSGGCAGLTVQGQAVGDLLWTLHPAALLTGKLAAHVLLTNSPATASADIEARSSRQLTLTNLVADLPLDPAVLPKLPPGLRGSAHLDLKRLELTNSVITQLEGKIEAHDLEDRTIGTTPFGSYSVTFPPGTGRALKGQLHDLGGPLSVEGTLSLTLNPGTLRYTLEGLVAARPMASAELKQSLQILGSPDARGRRPFSEERTLSF
jgi:general secretion pathway protein N